MRIFGFFIIRWARLQEIHRRMAQLRAENDDLKKKLQDKVQD